MPTQDPLKRLKCAYDECQNDRKYYCFDHKLRLCSDCCDSLHYNCTVQAIRSKDELWNAVGLLHHFVASLTKKANAYKLMENISGLANCMKHISGLFEAFEQEARIAMKKDQFLKFHLLIEEARKIKSDIFGGNFGRVGNYEPGSNPILKLLFDSELVGLTYSKIGAVQKESIRKSPEFEETVREVTTEFKDHIEAKTKKEIQEKAKEIEEKTEAKYQKQIQDLQEDMKSKEKIEKIVIELTNKIKAQEDLIGREQIQKDDFERELSALTLQHNQLQSQHEDLKNTLDEKQKESDQREVCEAMHKDTIGETKTYDSNFKLELYLDKENQKQLMEAYARNKIKLPPIKRVFFQNIKNEHLDKIDQFLTHSVPDKLSLLALNHTDSTLIDGSKIIKGLESSLHKVIKEIWIYYFEFQPSELETIFRSSTNTEKLCIVVCKINTQEKMDFGTKQTKISYLSFNCSGSNHGVNWGSNPKDLENIIEAISRSSVKDSLQTLNTRSCKLSVSKVEEMLSTHKLSNIKVIEKGESPLTE
ncbi:unnamed protein product [Moneuplotes crassus]|uniref:Uncharacterized protein n=1 Tax=Euplotes crassus TaxID=5936 RepID=A0AAD1UB18_EUPCR|nr:unnamed protein product [Moneuplotes crassus]